MNLNLQPLWAQATGPPSGAAGPSPCHRPAVQRPPKVGGIGRPKLGCGVPFKDNSWLTGDTWAQEGVKLRLHVDASTPSHVAWKMSLPKCQRLCYGKPCLVNTKTLPREELLMHTFLTQSGCLGSLDHRAVRTVEGGRSTGHHASSLSPGPAHTAPRVLMSL